MAQFIPCNFLRREWRIIFGDSWRQKVVSVFKFGRRKSNFFWPKITKIGRFWVPKNGTLDAQIRKRTPLFVANYPQKWWNRHLFHMFLLNMFFWQPFPSIYWYIDQRILNILNILDVRPQYVSLLLSNCGTSQYPRFARSTNTSPQQPHACNSELR